MPDESKITGNLQSGFTNERCNFAKASGGHAHDGACDAKAGVYRASVIPDGRCDAANVRLVFLQITGKAVFSYPRELGLQFLDAAYGIFGKAVQFEFIDHSLALFVRQVRKHHLAHRGAIERNAGANAGVNAQGFGRIQLLDIDGGKFVADGQVNRLARGVIQMFQMSEADPTYIQLLASRLTKRYTRDPQVIIIEIVLVKKSACLQVDKKAMNRADGQTAKLRDFGSGESAAGLAHELQHAQAALERYDIVFPFFDGHKKGPGSTEMKIESTA